MSRPVRTIIMNDPALHSITLIEGKTHSITADRPLSALGIFRPDCGGMGLVTVLGSLAVHR
jgi:hypothetical protein